MITNLATEISADKKIMVTFGSGSVKTNGVYEQVCKALEGKDVTEFWGIESNPKIETLRKAIELGKEKNIDFILAVGGGSVIDGTKLIAAGLLYEGDAWELVKEGKVEKSIPFGTVLTLPATGSEMNSGAVISNGETKEKFAFYSNYPEFSVLDPEVTFSLPPYQIACGIADTFVHVMEQYLTKANQSRMMDRWAEGILMLLTTIAPIIKKNIEEEVNDYDVMAEFMLSSTMGLNGFISMGVPQDWGTHMIGHELTALTGMTHGATLAIVLPGLLRTLVDVKREKLIQYGERIWGITTGLPETRAMQAIDKTEEFFRSLGLNTRLGEANVSNEVITEIERRFNERNVAFGENQNITGRIARDILLTCK